MNDSRSAVHFALRAGLWALVAFCGTARGEDFKLSDVKPGLTGTALTAGVGNTLERFDVRVLETVQDGDLPLILVRASGAFLDTVGGVGQGFSGSPVYIGDKLLGAISGGFPNGDGRLVLVTPIERMRRATPPTPAALLSVLPLGLRRACLPDLGCAVPLATPLTVSGLGARALGVLRGELEARGLNIGVAPLQTGGSSPARNFNYKLEPGAPIAAQLVSGDISVGATGTVTAVDGRNVLAFGHPVFGDARVRSLMQGAFVAGFVPSSVVPFKIAQTVGEPIGTFINDRPYGLGGVVGALNPLPLEISVRRGGTTRVTKLNLAPVPDLSGVLLLASSYGALDNLLEGDSPGSARLTLRLEFTDRAAPLEYGDRVADGDDIARTAARRAALLLALIAENPYAAPNLKRVTLNLEVAPYNALRIVKADLERKTMKAGEATTINVRLQPFRTPSVQRRVAFRVPADAQPGTLRLRVRGAGTPRPQVDNLQNPDPWDGVLTFEELLERMRSRATGEACIVETTGTDPQAVGLENVGEVVTGWVYVDVQVVK